MDKKITIGTWEKKIVSFDYVDEYNIAEIKHSELSNEDKIPKRLFDNWIRSILKLSAAPSKYKKYFVTNMSFSQFYCVFPSSSFYIYLCLFITKGCYLC